MSKALTLVAVVLLSSCGKKKDDAPAPGSATPAPTGSAPAPTVSAPAPTGSAPAAAAKLDCDRVFAKALREKYFADAKIEDKTQGIEFAGGCGIEGADYTADITVTCNDVVSANMAETLKLTKQGSKDMTDLVGVGKGGVTSPLATIGTQATAWDDDSNCMVTVMVTGSKKADTIAITKDLLATLPIK